MLMQAFSAITRATPPIRFIALGLAIWMAHTKGRNVIVWGALCFAIPPLTIILAFMPRVIRPQDVTRCPKCQGPVLKGSGNCPRCGEGMPIDMVECKNCGKFVPEGSRCSECGAPLH